MIFDRIEWDEHNLDHATRHGVTAAEIEQVITNAPSAHRSRSKNPREVRVLIDDRTDGGRRVRVAVQLKPGRVIRPITAWEPKR